MDVAAAELVGAPKGDGFALGAPNGDGFAELVAAGWPNGEELAG